MSDSTFQLIAIAVYLAAMLAIGYFAFKRTNDIDDYMLAGRGLKPGVAALSAGASDMSGWLLMGLPGAIYLNGLIEAWIAIGLTIGAWLNWKFVAPRLRSYTAVAQNAITIPSFFEKRLKDNSHFLRIAASVIILAFFTFYVSSGMVAAGKFFESSFGWNYFTGLFVVAGVTLLYTLFGGFLGATLTDVAQGLLMFAALIAVPIVAIFQMGNIGDLGSKIKDVNPEALNLFSSFNTTNGFLAAVAIFSTAAWGLGYFGQPHIIVRFMALRSPSEAKTARRIGISWMVLTAVGAIVTALVGIAYFADSPEKEITDPETVFLLLSQIFFHPFVAGLVLAAVLAAIMSTMSSQLIVCSSALVEDLYNIAGKKLSPQREVMLGRSGVLVVAIVAAALALNRDSSILDLVSFAWAGFGAAFGPIVLLSLYWRKLTSTGALAGMLTGAVTVFVWGNIDVLSSAMYEIVPGFVLNLVVAVLVSRATYKHNATIEEEFTAMENEVEENAPYVVS
ncbi:MULTISPECIES: sodium/proline symporter PutP [Paeniglutamicibacter]|uniref:Sodium/proline symporter n=1 Tax=Paeniglutamicibacter sulfureus TaxID=43666 RepID=A0ABU2BL24_9MICC|nr:MULTISPECIES: sodium/proline symporter PutP [Paeniglutamicibacter]MCV9994896.1 sodium/proline symporter PutP [Paeniglutamicibacter sp. ZC-3]MDO2935029.1 sodium/proline symporter PutP [Paeniglutamicibacter sulfureus]MDR7359341.1 sodium/proline symporter [Paeniglutamicibacter sulfureus]